MKRYRNQEGTEEGKEDVHKENKADLFGMFISALLSICSASPQSVLQRNRWIVTKYPLLQV